MAIIENSARCICKSKNKLHVINNYRRQIKKTLIQFTKCGSGHDAKVGYARSANEKLTRDAFATDALEEQDEAKSEIREKDGKSLDFFKRTLREFNDDIDEFSEISPKRSLSGILIICLVLAF